MSIRIMSAVWGVSLPDSDKLVLLALADCANDEGVCWPSMATLVAKCSKTDRTIQTAVKSLAAAGHLSRLERPGKGVLYTVHPGGEAPEAASPPKRLPPEDASPPKPVAPTPEAASDKPSRTTIASTEASPPTKRRDAWPVPAGVEPDDWRDLMVNRKLKRLANTPAAHRRMLADLDKHADEEWPPGRIVQHAAERGWGAIFDPRPRDRHNGQRPHHHDRNRDEPVGPILRAALARQARSAG